MNANCELAAEGLQLKSDCHQSHTSLRTSWHPSWAWLLGDRDREERRAVSKRINWFLGAEMWRKRASEVSLSVQKRQFLESELRGWRPQVES